MAVLYLLLGGNESAIGTRTARRSMHRRPSMTSWLLKGARVLGGEPLDVLLEGGVIVDIGAGLSHVAARPSSTPTG